MSSHARQNDDDVAETEAARAGAGPIAELAKPMWLWSLACWASNVPDNDSVGDVADNKMAPDW